METPAAIAELLKENWRRRRVVALEGILGWKWRHLVIPPTPDECSSIRMMETVMVHQLGDKFTLSTALGPCTWVSEGGRDGWSVWDLISTWHTLSAVMRYFYGIFPFQTHSLGLSVASWYHCIWLRWWWSWADPGHPSIHSIAGQPEK